ncbi:hypothetical protein PRIPAC_92970, partial [Pristionchus pacificus]|uniref:Uncharacterized protein n=1 Tax=Pristionchus pacificus TaxID=54126 RepID=A0A2A6BAX3_PRIPA
GFIYKEDRKDPSVLDSVIEIIKERNSILVLADKNPKLLDALDTAKAIEGASGASSSALLQAMMIAQTLTQVQPQSNDRKRRAASPSSPFGPFDLYSLCSRVGITKFTPHQLRGGGAMESIRRGASIDQAPVPLPVEPFRPQHTQKIEDGQHPGPKPTFESHIADDHTCVPPCYDEHVEMWEKQYKAYLEKIGDKGRLALIDQGKVVEEEEEKADTVVLVDKKADGKRSTVMKVTVCLFSAARAPRSKPMTPQRITDRTGHRTRAFEGRKSAESTGRFTRTAVVREQRRDDRLWRGRTVEPDRRIETILVLIPPTSDEETREAVGRVTDLERKDPGKTWNQQEEPILSRSQRLTINYK